MDDEKRRSRNYYRSGITTAGKKARDLSLLLISLQGGENIRRVGRSLEYPDEFKLSTKNIY